MVTETLEAQLHDASLKETIRQQIFNLIPQFRLKSILRRHHLNREVVIGLIGHRGEGKSGSGAVLSLVDFMMEGIPTFSNMSIKCDISIDDETARQYSGGLLHSGGMARFASLDLDKKKLLRFDPMFKRCLIFIDEINVEFSEARRFMTNTNLFFNRLVQELRHYEASMIYTAISEMHVDSRLRELTDVFIKTEDTALSIDGLSSRKPTGIDFKWIMYAMSRYLTGISYYQTKQALPPYYLHFHPFRGIYDDKEVQGEGMYKYGVDLKGDDGDMQAAVTIEKSPVVKAFNRDWGWFAPIANELLARTDEFVPAREIWENPEVVRRRVAKGDISSHLKETYGIPTRRPQFEGERATYYQLPKEPIGGRL